MADVIITDARTGEVTERTFTPEELAQRQADEAEHAARQAVEATLTGNRTTLEDRAAAALAANRTYLGLASPTAAQQRAQVAALPRQNTAVIRLLLNRLDGTD